MRARNPYRILGRLTLPIVGLAALLRVIFVLGVLASARTTPPDKLWNGYPTGYLTNDSPTYLEPARQALRGNFAAIGSLERPPGYPAFLAILGASPAPVLLVQALLGAVTVGVGALLAYLFTGHARLSAGAALVLAVSPTGIGLTGLIMADLLLGAVFAGAFLLLVASVRYRRPAWLYAAGLLFGLGAMVKPILFVWAPCGLLVAWLAGGGRTRFVPVRSLALFVGLEVLPGALWAARNYARDGVLTVSSVGPRTARLYLASKIHPEGAAALGERHDPPSCSSRPRARCAGVPR